MMSQMLQWNRTYGMRHMWLYMCINASINDLAWFGHANQKYQWTLQTSLNSRTLQRKRNLLHFYYQVRANQMVSAISMMRSFQFWSCKNRKWKKKEKIHVRFANHTYRCIWIWKIISSRRIISSFITQLHEQTKMTSDYW